MRAVGRFSWWVVLALVAMMPAGALAAQDSTLIIGTTDKVTQLEPANSYDFWTWHVLEQTTGTLVTPEPGTARLVPSLAERWQISSDAKVYTFYLRRGVTFTDGTPFNAQAMKWSLERALKLDGPEGAVGLIKGIDKIEAVDEYTLRITLKQSDATFLARLADPIAPVMAFSPKSMPADKMVNGQYAGTGPYKLVRYDPDQRVVLEAYDKYWGPKPKTQRIIEVFYSDASALRAALESGQIDVGFRTFNPEDIASLEKDGRFAVIKGKGSLSVRYIVFNVTQKPFDNPALRRALALAIDRERIVSDVFGGLNAPLYSMVPPGMWSHIEAYPKRDVEGARKALAALGYSQSKPLTITLWYTPSHYGTTEGDVAAVVKDSLEETGLVKVDVQALEWGTYVTRMSEGALGMFFLGWYPDFLDPDNFLAPWLTEAPGSLGTHLDRATSEADRAYYREFVRLLTAAKHVSDQDIRERFYVQAQQKLAESAILIPLWQNSIQHLAIAQRNVEGIVLDPSMNFRTWLMYKK
ncbi:MAG: peptide ABC transporter substrate-binding protein [Limnochordaceae bacterium]|nr:peptide ABC transporter substrate-binding protein [Limnochordaceae bacterium]